MSGKATASDLKAKALLLVRYALAGGLTSGVYVVVYNIFVYFEVVRFLSSNLAYGSPLALFWQS